MKDTRFSSDGSATATGAGTSRDDLRGHGHRLEALLLLELADLVHLAVHPVSAARRDHARGGRSLWGSRWREDAPDADGVAPAGSAQLQLDQPARTHS
jgi:hypothetical protein